jgi:hypothetical protein
MAYIDLQKDLPGIRGPYGLSPETQAAERTGTSAATRR